MTAWTTPFLELMHQQLCDYCGAKPGEHCVTTGGRKCRPHSARYYAARKVRDGE